MRIIVIAILIVFNLILESTFFQYMRFFGVKPDFTMVLIVSFSILRGKNYSTFIGLFSGLLIDLMYGHVIGINALSYMLTGFLIGQFHESVFKDSYFPAILFNIVGVLIYQHIFLLISYFTKVDIVYTNAILKVIIPQCFYNALIGGVLYRYFFRLDNKNFMDKRFY